MLAGHEIILGRSSAATILRERVDAVVKESTAVLLVGETGTGKEVIARAIHDRSRPRRPFIAINCAAIPISLLAAELFGVHEGAFTGAVERAGAFESADRGTLLLDEIDELSPDAQPAVMAAVAAREVRRLGDAHVRRFDVRLIAASNREFDVSSGRPSAEFVRRTAAAVIKVPALRDRRDDIPEYVEVFARTSSDRLGRDVRFQPSALKLLTSYDFPGNLRELQNIVHRAAVASSSGTVTREHVEHVVPNVERRAKRQKPRISDLRRQLDDVRRELELVRASTITARPIWEGRSFRPEIDSCFVLMPFGAANDVQLVYQNHVRPIVEGKFRFRCERADDIYGVTGVMQSVWEGINRARVVIAELTGRNPNVFYELGIAHTLGKPVIMLSQSIDDVPFDLRHLRCILYRYRPTEIERLETALSKTITNVINSTGELGLRLE